MPLVTIDKKTHDKLVELAYLKKTTQKELVENAVRAVYLSE